MSRLAYILVFSFIGSVASLGGAVALIANEKLIKKLAHLLSALAAGVLLGAAFFDLLPEAAAAAPEKPIFGYTAGGILFFFLMERFIHWFHHHREEDQHAAKAQVVVPLLMFGDTLHNFIDGLAIGAAFLVDIRAGIITSIAAAAHEIPQEIGDFGVMFSQGLSRAKVIWYNFLSALAAMAGALLVYFSGSLLSGWLPQLLALTAGMFIYIAASDIIPEIHSSDRPDLAIAETLLLVGGVVVTAFLSALLRV